MLSGDVGVDVVKHELFAHRVEGTEILSDVVIDIVAREQIGDLLSRQVLLAPIKLRAEIMYAPSSLISRPPPGR